MELDDAIHTAILTLKEGYLIPHFVALLLCLFQNILTEFWTCRYEGQISSNNIEIGIIQSDREFKYRHIQNQVVLAATYLPDAMFLLPMPKS